ncbi:MAG: site-specific DNA-methyltransferase [Gammaproteobacteria bacterium]|nr:site-specific DNA-methyltransferase [Gammaproteobacteria bacterium]MYK43960.1 site-specific DNA-methyltransferase [Gammaproteobacteria bacterium]
MDSVMDYISSPIPTSVRSYSDNFFCKQLALSTVYCDDSSNWLIQRPKDHKPFDLVFLDPPFNQGKDYRHFDDSNVPEKYWNWIAEICNLAYHQSCEGASIYFMQREKNTSETIQALKKTGWFFQNLIIWKKKTSAIPGTYRFSKSYQIIVYATKGKTPKTFNSLRIDPPVPSGYKPRPQGVRVTDVWDDIRELTSGYYAGKEVLRDNQGERIHKQQSPISLLLRIILTSSCYGDLILDPFAGTGTTMVVAQQLQRESIGIDVDPVNVEHIIQRLRELRTADSIDKHRPMYRHTENLNKIWDLGLY